jgi:septum formation protein
MSALILASASPRRRDLLQRIGLAFEVRPAEIDESWRPGESPRHYVARVAAAKLDAIVAPGHWVLAADTTVTFGGLVLGKAADTDEARAMLSSLSGREHEVMTAFALRGPGGEVAEVVTTVVEMIDFSGEMLEQYLASGEWRGKAGAYAIQGIGAAMVAAVRGSVTNVIGLPLAEVVQSLRRLGGPMPQLERGAPE